MRYFILTFALAGWIQAQTFPDRESFAKHDRPVESVPLEAFEFGEDYADHLRIDVWAQSPLIYSPVAMDVDAKGRLWCTEGIDYSVRRRVASGQSIIVLQDTDDDGKADASHVFVSEKNARHAPLGIAVFDNRIVLSATPSITVYTDVNRNAVFDPDIDKKEIFLTGFKNDRHDHTLHAVVGSPSGHWYFSYGNCGADIQTKDGRHFLSGCYYGYPEAIGKASSDGHVYVGGVAMRINPDGTGLSPIGENLRNAHDMVVTSFGDVLQSDNDDPAHARSSWLMEHGNMGYADLRDGSRSWEEVAKTWEEPAGWHRDLRYSRSHWRENYPGATPPGTIYGAGSPTGNAFIEGDELGRHLRGTYLVCCMVRKEVMACRPQLADVEIAMGKHRPFLKLKRDRQGEHFLPTDVVLGTDGSLYLSDFYNDTSRRTNQVSGIIYRITRRDDSKAAALPNIDYTSPEGLLRALKNPAVNVRSTAVEKLNSLAPELTSSLKEYYAATAENPYLQARAIWLLARSHQSRPLVEALAAGDDPAQAIAAFRALKMIDPAGSIHRATALAGHASASVRREVALSLRDASFDDARKALEQIIENWVDNRWYLEAIGIAATNKEAELYREIIQPKIKAWNKKTKDLAWILHTPEAIADLDQVMRTQTPAIGEFRHLAMAYASFRNDAERSDRHTKLTALGKLPAFAGDDYQITIAEILAKDLNDLKGEFLTSSHLVPPTFGVETKTSNAKTIGALEGAATRGEVKAQLCLVCHKIAGKGVAFGPDLTHWGRQRTVEEIVTDIIDPNAKLAHGYDQPVRLSKGEHVAEGFLSNFSWHAGSLKIKLFGGVTKKILFRRGGVKIERLGEDHSWMPPASRMGLTDQDVRDIAAYLKDL